MRRKILLVVSIIVLSVGGILGSLDVKADTVGSVDMFHTHAGDSAGGGCYTVENACGGEIKAKKITTSCGGTCTITSWCTAVCNKCGKTHTNNICAHGRVLSDCTECNGNTANAGYNIWPIGQCNANQSTRTIYLCSTCGKEYSEAGVCNSVTYTLGCGQNDGDKVGTVSIDRQVSEQNYVLTPKVGGTAACIGNVSCSPSSHQVTSNGSYAFTVNYTDSGVSKSVTVSCTISDYDGTAPVINSVTASTTEKTSRSVSLSVNATDNVGVTAYKMDGGSWQSGNSFSVNKNGTYTFYAKDGFGNVSGGYAYEVTNIVKKENPSPVTPEDPVKPSEPAEDEPVEESEPAEKEPEETKEKETKKEEEETETEEIIETEEMEETEETEETMVEPVILPTIPIIKPTQDKEKPEEIIEEPAEKNDKKFASQIGTACAIGTANSGFIVFIVFWIFRKCIIYEQATNKKIGKACIWKRKKEYEIKISNEIVKKADGKIYIIFSKNFVKANNGKPIKIGICGGEIVKSIQEKIVLSI